MMSAIKQSILCALLGALLSSLPGSVMAKAVLGPGDLLPHFTLKSLNPTGITSTYLSLDKIVGESVANPKKVVLVSFFATYCEPCKKEMKELDKINIKYGNKGFDYVSINIDSPRSMSKVKSYINSQKFSFTVLSDPKASLFRKTGGKIMPFVIIADTTGTILSRHVGYNPGDEKKLEKEIIHLLGLSVLEGDTINEKLEIPNIDTSPDIPTETK